MLKDIWDSWFGILGAYGAYKTMQSTNNGPLQSQQMAGAANWVLI